MGASRQDPIALRAPASVIARSATPLIDYFE
jgi:hypothetical protein